MDNGKPFRGSLFSHDFLSHSVKELPDWKDLDSDSVDSFNESLREIFSRFPVGQKPNESQTETDLIWPVLRLLGWGSSLKQQNLAVRGRQDVPDGLLFADESDKEQANSFAEEWKRYQFGLAVVECKRWLRPLDRRSGTPEEMTAPSTQMLRYLRRVDDVTEGRLRWGILTNGAKWRLYYQGARSVSEQFLEIDLGKILNVYGDGHGAVAFEENKRRHWLSVFILVFRREAFVHGPSDPRTFHQRSIEKSRFYEERVAGSLSEMVFRKVFPDLARAMSAAAPEAPLEQVRDAALIFLYRLLFILYAEDRDLLPVNDSRYDDYALRDKVRLDVGRRKDQNDIFSEKAARYWNAIDDLCLAMDEGDTSIGLPPYNGGLFDREATPLLEEIKLSDSVMADLIDALSFERTETGRSYINYRDLGVQQLGSIYERLLEYELALEDGEVVVRPNIFARKDSGSYYTPDDLVGLIVKEAVEPLARRRMDEFESKAGELAENESSDGLMLASLREEHDPAERLLELKICDPAMGSGHFLVCLVDFLADSVISAMADSEALVENYVSPLNERIERIRSRIMVNAKKRKWSVDYEHLEDRDVIRRMVLKRCVYGVDRNPMAVELAKVSLWLHTFTPGAPLNFIDHHLRCGNSLFGTWVKEGLKKAKDNGGHLLLGERLDRAEQTAAHMQIVESLTDEEISEAHRSADIFKGIKRDTAPLDSFLSLIHAFDWLDIKDREDKEAINAFLVGTLGDPVDIALGKRDIKRDTKNGKAQSERFTELLGKARELIEQERFCNWQVMFPGVWSDWDSSGLRGGFDAVIGNPPWDRIKLQQVEWFAVRRPEIAHAPRAADRKRMIAELEKMGDPFAEDFNRAKQRTEQTARVARTCGDYPLLSGGDINLYSLFVERAMKIVKPDGMVGLLVPSGIASDRTSAKFFKEVATGGRLKAFYDFENRKVFFPDIHASFKFCIFIAGMLSEEKPARCGFYIHQLEELKDPECCFPLTSEDFSLINPNTGTMPIFRSRRDAELTGEIYKRVPVLVNRSGEEEVKTWPVKYIRMFDMTNDSGFFRTREQLEEKEKAYPIAGNRFGSPKGEWVPLYVGRMIHQFDHRAASVKINPENLHNPALSGDISPAQKAEPDFVPTPQYWVPAEKVGFPDGLEWAIAFRDIARPTDARTMIASGVPFVGLGNTAPVLTGDYLNTRRHLAPCLIANFNSVLLDYIVRQKVQSTHLNWYIVEQLPVIPPDSFEAVRFGPKTAGEIVREAVLELVYTAHDMAPFARDMGYVDEDGEARPPFLWDEERRLRLRARLDAVFFHLYGVTDRDDVRHVFSAFPIVEAQETKTYGSYLSCELCLGYMNALESGDPDAEISL
ncbi:MAG: restriction endonuclease [Candidatus Dadabacteria bacterium]|nr:restriction endonuclease [Candidatus Dadabacteria bacterium]MDE0476751.1 restriction endonuclease [Candidatus Dadabacteria bacterium]